MGVFDVSERPLIGASWGRSLGQGWRERTRIDLEMGLNQDVRCRMLKKVTMVEQEVDDDGEDDGDATKTFNPRQHWKRGTHLNYECGTNDDRRGWLHLLNPFMHGCTVAYNSFTFCDILITPLRAEHNFQAFLKLIR